MIEVKNFRPKNEWSPYVIDRDYLHSLTSYAELVDLPLKIAIFWSHLNLWTLLDSGRFDTAKKKIEIPLTQALEGSEMNDLGDRMLGTELPLAFRLYADKEKPRTVATNGEAPFTVGSVALLVNNTEVTDELEKKLTWFLINYGQWDEVDQPAEITDGELEYFEFVFSKNRTENDEDFTTIGFVSQMLSRQYLDATSPNDAIRLLIPTIEPSDMGVAIPKDYTGDVLRLWRFNVRPKPQEDREQSVNDNPTSHFVSDDLP